MLTRTSIAMLVLTSTLSASEIYHWPSEFPITSFGAHCSIRDRSISANFSIEQEPVETRGTFTVEDDGSIFINYAIWEVSASRTYVEYIPYTSAELDPWSLEIIDNVIQNPIEVSGTVFYKRRLNNSPKIEKDYVIPFTGTAEATMDPKIYRRNDLPDLPEHRPEYFSPFIKIRSDIGFDIELDGTYGELDFGSRLLQTRGGCGAGLHLQLPFYNYGDANNDRYFDSSDLVQVFLSGKYETGEVAVWKEGDWNGDSIFDSADLIVALRTGEYEKATNAVYVPEPNALNCLIIGLCVVTFFVVQNRGRR